MRYLSLSSGPAYCPLEFRNKCTYSKIASFGNSTLGVKSHKKERERWVNVNVNVKRRVRVSGSGSGSGSGEHYRYELTTQNVDLVLEEVRPYLIADGGNVQVSSVDHGIITLQLEGACGSCPSSTTTMKMGIERVLKEKFGDAVKDIRQANEQVNETTVEAVNSHLDILRPAIKNYGGEVDVIAIVGGDCTVKYKGPDTIGSGIKAAIKEKFPEISNVIFTG